MNCTACGSEIDDGAAYCPHCGHAVGAPEPAGRSGPAEWGIEPAAARGVGEDTARALLPQLAFLFAVAAFVGVALMPDGYHGSPADWGRAAVLVAAAALRGGVVLASDDDPSEGGEAVVAYLMPLLATLTGLGAVAWVAARRERVEPSATARVLAGRSVLTGAAYAVALAVLGVAANGPVPYVGDSSGDSVRTRPATLSLLFGGLLLASLAAAAGRGRVAARREGHAGLRRTLLDRAGAYGAAIEAAALALALTAAGGLLYAIAHTMIELSDGIGTGDRLRLLAVLLLLAPNVALVSGGFVSGATVGGTAGFEFALLVSSQNTGSGFLAGGVPGKYWLLLLIPLAAAVVAGTWLAGRTDPGDQGWSGWHRPGVALAGLWLVAGLATQLGVTNEPGGALLGYRGSGELSGRAGLGLPSVMVCGFAFGTLIWLVARYAGPAIGSAFPAVFRRGAGEPAPVAAADDAGDPGV